MANEVWMCTARAGNAILLGMLLVTMGTLNAQSNLLTIDAAGPEVAETALTTGMGTPRNPAGHTIGATSQNLTFDGKPWLPVMGEMHYSRVPESEWEPNILRMKSAGVNIIATYIFWIHHEQERGHFIWSGNKDLRHFARLCAKHGMYLYPRIGPWAHGEARNGGFPDWVAAGKHTRENAPEYLAEVDTLYRQIGEQLKGLYWKDGGPVIGLQLENEYVATGAGKGAEHIHTLKSMALAAGMDVPLYTVTGWGGAAAPADAVLPVFGGYPDAPWDGSPNPMPPPEVYNFRFDNRSTGNMGAMGGSAQVPPSSYKGTPFLTAEVGGGIQDTYFRRPVVSPDDVAAMLPVMLGSGANLIGYYMFAGGRNPDGGAVTLQESQRSGYPTDVPVKSYDFQAPLGNNGEERASLRRLKLVHYFLNDFGAELAPMRVHRPDLVPASPKDLSVARVSARTQGNSGYLFVNNLTRGAVMPARAGFQVRVKLPGETVRVPDEPITLPSGAYGIWPVNLDLNGVRLRYGTAQLMTRLEEKEVLSVFFFTLPGVPAEFLLDAPASAVTARGFRVGAAEGGVRLRATADSGDVLLHHAGKTLRLVLLSRADAENVWKVDDGRALLLTEADVLSNGAETTLEQEGRAEFAYSLFHASATIHEPLFVPHRGSVQPVPLTITARQTASATVRAALRDGPPVSWRKAALSMAPDDPDFADAERFTLTLRGDLSAPQLADARVRIRYSGDVARLRQGGRLLDDDFWNGLPWTFGVRWVGIDPASPIDIAVLPLPKGYPMYLERQPEDAETGSVARLDAVEVVPVYRWSFTLPPGRAGTGRSPAITGKPR